MVSNGRCASPRVPPPKRDELPCARGACEREREELMELLAHQQRVAQAGLVTAGLAHDVNNQAQSISGAVYLALMSDRPAEWREALVKIQEHCCGLSDLSRAFLSFVRRRGEGPDSFSAAETVAHVCRLVRPLAKEQSVQLEHAVTRDSEISGERQLLAQAIVNLVSNGIRACPSGGRVSVRVSRPNEGCCRIEVADDGDGIPDEVRRRLFRPFATTHNGMGGTGLGLFIVRRAVRSLQGSIRVTSSTDGTLFGIELPTTD